MPYRPVRLQTLNMLIPTIILVLLSALVASDPDFPNGGNHSD